MRVLILTSLIVTVILAFYTTDAKKNDISLHFHLTPGDDGQPESAKKEDGADYIGSEPSPSPPSTTSTPSPPSPPSPSPCTTCSRKEHCTLGRDSRETFLGQVPTKHLIRSECSCRDHCSSYAGCSWYIWYDDHPESGRPAGTCYLFSSSAEGPTCWPCSHCFSGPSNCLE